MDSILIEGPKFKHKIFLEHLAMYLFKSKGQELLCKALDKDSIFLT